MSKSLAKSTFEEGVLIRDLGDIALAPDVALAELVANAWDAGAAFVHIDIPEELGGTISVHDDGVGLSESQFRSRWMRYGYNRADKQGRDADFPPSRAKWSRKAYGRNGMGRHALLCFADEYSVETRHWDGSEAIRFRVATSSNDSAFVLVGKGPGNKDSHGTSLFAAVSRNLPNVERIRDSLSFKFLHDPQFAVFVNGEKISLEQHETVAELELQLDGRDIGKVICVKVPASRTRKMPHGVSFWVGGRLVGEPTYNLFGIPLLDGRTAVSNRHMFVVKTPTLHDDVREDWSSFRKTQRTLAIAEQVGTQINQLLGELMKDEIEETKKEAIRENREDLRTLSRLGKMEIGEFVDILLAEQPMVSAPMLTAAVKAAVNLEKSRHGRSLLEKLASISEDDVERLDRFLDTWSLREALAVLEEIDRRLSVVQAIEKLMDDPETDELHTLHPLVTQSRWLFGPEYDSPMYSSNMTIVNASKKVFKKRIDPSGILNTRQRPDLIFLKDATMSLTGTEEFDTSGTVVKLTNLLVIELKKGDSLIGSKEVSQGVQYVTDLLNCDILEGAPFVKAFVVGARLDKRVKPLSIGAEPISARVEPATFSQLARTAHQRLFKLQERIGDRYKSVQGEDLVDRILGEPVQSSLFSDKVPKKRIRRRRSRSAK